MKYRFFYVPNTLATLQELVLADIPPGEARNMLGKTFGIQYVNPIAEPAVYQGVPWGSYASDGAAIENYDGHNVRCWTIPLAAVELREVAS